MSPDEVEPAADAPPAAEAQVHAAASTDAAASEAVVAEAAPSGPVCRICATPREPGQDWCLSCGTAFTEPRRLPPLRSLGVATVATLVLLSGAAVASVAAIDDKKPPAATVVATVAQPAPAPVNTPDDTATDAPITPVAPIDTTPITPTPVTPTPVTTTPATTTTTTTTTTTPKPDATRITLSSGSGALYDPLARALETGDPQRAIDGDPGTSWFVTTPADGDMNVGYLLDLGEPMALKRLEVLTKTPGMALRILAATTADPPPNLDDSGWTEIGQEPDAGLDDNGKPRSAKTPVKIPLQTDGKKFRLVAITIETPPLSGTTARFTELRLFS